MIKIYTDGSCIEHGARGGFGVVVYKDGKIIKLYNERHIDTTNNRMELSAILWALKNYGGPEEITICSDSQYCINTLSKWMFNWVANDWVKADGKTPENLDIIQDFYALRKQGYKGVKGCC